MQTYLRTVSLKRMHFMCFLVFLAVNAVSSSTASCGPASGWKSFLSERFPVAAFCRFSVLAAMLCRSSRAVSFSPFRPETDTGKLLWSEVGKEVVSVSLLQLGDLKISTKNPNRNKQSVEKSGIVELSRREREELERQRRQRTYQVRQENAL